MFTLEQIFCFKEVFETGAYSAAGKRMGKTRTTVREHIMALEDSSGLVLFTLQGKRLVPTEHAQSLYPRTCYLAKHARDLRETMVSLYDSELTELIIYHDALIPTSFLHAALEALATEFPFLQLKLLCRVREVAYEDIKQGKAHIALMASENLTATSAEIENINLGTLRLRAFVSAKHPLAEQEQIATSELRLVKQYMTESAAMGGLGGYSMSTNRQVVSSVGMLLDMVQSDGWAILPEALALPYVNQKVLVPIKLEEFLQSQPHNICAFLPIHYRANKQLKRVAEIVCAQAREYLE